MLAAGCFWGVEEELMKTPGVVDTQVGFAQGITQSPSYKEVCTGATQHAEVVLVEFDSAILPFEKLLDRFWEIHNPTQVNRQGPDVGTQYRSGIYYFTEDQKEKATESKKDQDRSEKWCAPVVTEIEPAQTFFPAEDYHQKYFQKNGGVGCKI